MISLLQLLWSESLSRNKAFLSLKGCSVKNRGLRGWLGVLLVIGAHSIAIGAPPQPIKEIKIRAGQTADLWLGVNVTGKVNYRITTRDGSNNLRMWWILEPL